VVTDGTLIQFLFHILRFQVSGVRNDEQRRWHLTPETRYTERLVIQIGSEPEIRKWFENPDIKRIIEDVAGALYPLLKARKVFLPIYSLGELISKNKIVFESSVS